MGILLWVLFGALAGFIASAIMKGNGSLLVNIIIGIVGAVVGGWLMNILGQGGVNGFNLYSLLVAVIGSVVLITVVRAFRRTAV